MVQWFIMVYYYIYIRAIANATSIALISKAAYVESSVEVEY